MNKDSVEKIMKLKGDMEGFCGIRVEQDKIHIQTYAVITQKDDIRKGW